MHKRIITSLLAVLMAVSSASCAGPLGDTLDVVSLAKKTVTEQVKPDNASYFDGALFNEINRENEDRSFVFSPYSIRDCITLSYNGMNRKGKSALRFVGINKDAVDDMAVFDSMASGRKSLKIADKLFYNDSMSGSINKDAIRKDSSEALDMTHSRESADKINGWIEDETGGKIKDLVPEKSIDSSTAMLLCNAIWMKSAWKYDRDYDVSNGMFWEETGGDYEAFEGPIDLKNAKKTDGVTIARLPYKAEKGLSLSMYVIIPNSKKHGAIDRWIAKKRDYRKLLDFKNNKGPKGYDNADFHIPNFRATYQASVLDALKNIGLGEKFTDTPGLKYHTYSGLLKGTAKDEGGLCVTDVLHGAYMDTSIKGTEAAAATVQKFTYTSTASTPMTEKKTLHISAARPFAIAIKEDTSGQILFMGKIAADALQQFGREM